MSFPSLAAVLVFATSCQAASGLWNSGCCPYLRERLVSCTSIASSARAGRPRLVTPVDMGYATVISSSLILVFPQSVTAICGFMWYNPLTNLWYMKIYEVDDHMTL